MVCELSLRHSVFKREQTAWNNGIKQFTTFIVLAAILIDMRLYLSYRSSVYCIYQQLDLHDLSLYYTHGWIPLF